MMPFAALLLLSALAAPLQESTRARSSECGTWQECRQLALEAAARQDYEVFHDLAWRAVQKGPKNDPALMTLLARAQSLSGRPLDAIVMLQRLAAAGVVTDAATSDDFRRVRALPAWAEFQRSAEEREKPAPTDTTEASPPKAETPPAAPARSLSRAGAQPERAPAAHEKAPKPDSTVDPAEEPGGIGDATEALRFTTLPFTPAGLAHDGVSDRFIVGDRRARKLAVVDEASHRVANLAGARTAGFAEIAALEIDAHEGDLWVTSGDRDSGETMLHKLQLVSGRLLYTVAPPDDAGPAHFTDVAVMPRSIIVVLDDVGRRLFRLEPKSRELHVATRLDVSDPASVAPASDSIVYVAHSKGIVRVDFGARRTSALKTARNLNLGGLARIRWHRGALLGVQKSDHGTYRIVRIRLDARGARAVGLDVLDRGVAMNDPTAAAVSGDVLYYLAASDAAGGDGGAESIIRRVSVK